MSTIALPRWLNVVPTLFLISLAFGTSERALYNFGAPGSGDGLYPFAQIVLDSSGNLYGTTQMGGSYNAGILFELSPNGKGQWTETVLHEFTGGSDGDNPGAGLLFDSAGNIYGTAGYGGANGSGVVYELSPQSGGGWAYNVLYSFGAYPTSGDGLGPNSALVFDKQGNLFGTTSEGGVAGCFEGCGTVFELSPVGGGVWKEQLIHEFPGDGSDGELPSGGLTIDSSGQLYGTAQNGGATGSGILYQLRYSSSSNKWLETIVHQFTSTATDGGFPEGGVVSRGGHLYGTTEGGGVNGHGTIFDTTFSKSSGWVTTTLYSFGQSFSGDGISPQSGLTVDSTGNLYGTASYGGAFNYYGAAFELSKSANNTWSETILHSFNGTDGFAPVATPVLRGGRLYGTAPEGGANSSGVIYLIRP